MQILPCLMKITYINTPLLNDLLSNLSNASTTPSSIAKTPNPSPLSELSESQGVVLTIGNFDGLHLGHQQMINTTLKLASQKGLTSAVMVFEPMPKEFFAPTSAPARLMNRLETEYVFSHHHYQGQTLDELMIADFNKEFHSLSADEFVCLLMDKLNVKAVVIGDDFRFGHDRTGDSEFLRNCGLDVTIINTVTDNQPNHSRISSTRIRQLLQAGELTEANALLGRNYCMIGQVQHGDKIGRTLNFPTANVALDRLLPALHGVFAVDVQLLDNSREVIANGWQTLASDGENGISGLAKDSLFGTANIGTRPAVNGQEWRLEVHFPQFKGDLYGKLLKVRFLHFLHGECRYNGLEALKVGIESDVEQLLAWREAQG